MSSNQRKRPRRPAGSGGNNRWQQRQNATPPPGRGGPGMLCTCEQGRERQCRREALEILGYYAQHRQNVAPATADGNKKPTSLDDELSSLRHDDARTSLRDIPFAEFEIGCEGVVFLIYTGANESNDANVDDPVQKRPKTDTSESSSSSSPPAISSWDPFVCLQSIVADIIQPPASSSLPPSSRFVTRLVPMQTTCQATLDSLERTCRDLISRLLSQNPARYANTAQATTFGITLHRRNCKHIARDDIIQKIGAVIAGVAPHWTVHLAAPDVTVLLECCKMLAGVSVIPRETLLSMAGPKFNIAELRIAKNSSAVNDQDNDGTGRRCEELTPRL